MTDSEHRSSTVDILTTVFKYGEIPSVQFSSKAVMIKMRDPDDLNGELEVEDIPLLHQLPIIDESGNPVKRTIIYDEMVAFEMQQRPSKYSSPIYQVCARTIEAKEIFPFDQFVNCIRVVATYMAQGIDDSGHHDGESTSKLAKYTEVGFWSPRVKVLYFAALNAYQTLCKHPQVESSMITDEIFVTAQLSIDPFSFSLRLCPLPFSGIGTCQVKVCKGIRPVSFLNGIQLSDDHSGLTRLITPPISDVVLLHPETNRLSEGLISNFFATRRIKPNKLLRTAQAKQPLGYADYMLVCAPLATIHQGEALDLIWKICQRDNIQVSFAAPDLVEAMEGGWSGAFIVNMSYCVLPIDTMYLTDKHRTKVEFGKCPLISHLQTELLVLVSRTDRIFL